MAPRTTVLALLLLALAAPLGAQVPDSVRQRQDRERERRPPEVVRDTTDTLATAPAPAPAPGPPAFALSLSLGTGHLGTLQTQPVMVHSTEPLGGTASPFHGPKAGGDPGSPFAGGKTAVTGTEPLRRTLRSEEGFRVGLSALVALSGPWAVRLGGGLSRSRVRAEYTGEDTAFVSSTRFLPDVAGTGLTALSAEAALRMRLRAPTDLEPYLEMGVSALRLRSDGVVAGVPELDGGVARLAGTAAAGATFPLGAGFSADGQVAAWTFRTPVDAGAAGAAGTASRTRAVRFGAPDAALFADGARELTTVIRLRLGVQWGWGREVAAPPAPPEADASTTPPGR